MTIFENTIQAILNNAAHKSHDPLVQSVILTSPEARAYVQKAVEATPAVDEADIESTGLVLALAITEQLVLAYREKIQALELQLDRLTLAASLPDPEQPKPTPDCGHRTGYECDRCNPALR